MSLRKDFKNRLKLKLQKYNECKGLEINLGGKTTIDIQKKGVNKVKALRQLQKRYKFHPQNMIYFGDEFTHDGNDLPIANMNKSERPKLIVHVGDKKRTTANVMKQEGIILNFNGVNGTFNFLEFLLHVN